jgi:hypothetical protein
VRTDKRFDWRTPADTQDFETFVSKAPIPPVNLSVVKDPDGVHARVKIGDYEGPPERSKNANYRVYFLPSSSISATQLSMPDVLKSAIKLASVVGQVKASGNSVTIELLDSLNPSKSGWYFATGINRKGEESEATPPCASPFI